MQITILKTAIKILVSFKFPVIIVFSIAALVWYYSALAWGRFSSDGRDVRGYASNHSISAEERSVPDAEITMKLKSILQCKDRDYKSEIQQRGKYVVMKNYFKARHENIKCYESVTYATHADFTFLGNVPYLVARWYAPISIALYAPGTDFKLTVQTIEYLRRCLRISKFVQQFVTFHIYFEEGHMPKFIPRDPNNFNITSSLCTKPPPIASITTEQTYRNQMKLMYPANVGRNIARDAALTHFVLPSDIELYPTPGLERAFLEMIARNSSDKNGKPRVYPLAIFEVKKFIAPPRTKSNLIDLLKSGSAIPFHQDICQTCHAIPEYERWLNLSTSGNLSVFHIGRRLGNHSLWDPIFIGTQNDPHYEESLSWEGKRDKMTQGYIMCTLDYEYHILDNAFLVHKAGIKKPEFNLKRLILNIQTNELMSSKISPKLKVLYGEKEGCSLL